MKRLLVVLVVVAALLGAASQVESGCQTYCCGWDGRGNCTMWCTNCW